MPAVPTYVDAVVDHLHTLGAKSGTLLLAGYRTGGQAQSTASPHHSMPGQTRIVRQLRQDPTDPARRATQPSGGGKFAIAGDFAFWNLRQRQIQRGTPGIGIAGAKLAVWCRGGLARHVRVP